jgi:uncharacterized membrane protein YagU involved in acid resistance
MSETVLNTGPQGIPELFSQLLGPTLTNMSSAPESSSIQSAPRGKIFSFPNPVNETSARVVATGVVIMGLLFAVTQSGWVLIPLTYGFIARVLTGPFLSPLGRIATQVVTPRIHRNHKFVAGPPKRFAQAIGVVFSTTASVLWLAGAHTAATVVILMLVAAAALEAFAGFCLGCVVFAQLMRWNIIPQSVCEECNNISLRANASR